MGEQLMAEDLRTLRRDLTNAIRSVAQNVAAQATALAAVNAKTQRVGATITGPFPVGSVDVSVSWPSPWPDAGYGVWVAIISGTAALGSLSATLKSGTKTANDCTITVANTGTGPAGTFGLDVLGVRT